MKKLLVLISIMLLLGVPGFVACSGNDGDTGNTGVVIDDQVDDSGNTTADTGLVVQSPMDALDQVLTYLQGVDSENAPAADLAWIEEDKTPEQLLGSSTKSFGSGDWVVDMSYPIVAPENTIYSVTVRGGISGWFWQGTITAQGVVTEATPFAKLTEEVSKRIAEEFVRNSPTYLFDGMEDTFAYSETMTLKCPYCWEFVYTFESRAAGYGNRADMMLAQVITPHEAVVAVIQGQVQSAVMDGKWDMMTQTEIDPTPSEQKGVSYATVEAMLADSAYDVPLSVQGEISQLGELLCPCFELTSGNASVQVWYGLMVENDGTEMTEVDMTGFANGDTVVLTGILKGDSGTHYAKGDFWLEHIIPVN